MIGRPSRDTLAANAAGHLLFKEQTGNLRNWALSIGTPFSVHTPLPVIRARNHVENWQGLNSTAPKIAAPQIFQSA